MWTKKWKCSNNLSSVWSMTIHTLLWSWSSSPISFRYWPSTLSCVKCSSSTGRSSRRANRLTIPLSRMRCFWHVTLCEVTYSATTSTWEAGPSDWFQGSCTRESSSLSHQPLHKISIISLPMCAETLLCAYITCLWTSDQISSATSTNK